ncbi:MAG: enoyl-CoA hydratase/isomerase family protein [Candidatus Hydrogenedentota bacterium]|nr:MAG: enoyl-CoA hydratase/isomerase family protein [Candidatus Hydrogenedentota bacterium]
MAALPEFGTIIWKQEGPILTVTLNRPEKLNAFNGEMFRDVEQAVKEASDDPDVRIVVFTGAGRAFCSGADLTDLTDYHADADGGVLAQGVRQAQGVFDKVEALPKPTVAAINGHAVGAGLQLALACDFRIAALGAKLGLSDVKIGIIPALGATTRLPNLIGIAKTKELILTGDLISAEEAFKLGLVNRVVEKGSLGRSTKELAEKLASRAPLALAAAKHLLNSGASLDEVASAQSRLIKSADALEGISAFFEKRTPRFSGS